MPTILELLRAEQAQSGAEQSGLPGAAEGPQDAYRHALWSALLARDYGPAVSRTVTGAHELLGLGKGAYDEFVEGTPNALSEARQSSEMDFRNNRLGARLGAGMRPGTSDEALRAEVLARALRGELTSRRPPTNN